MPGILESIQNFTRKPAVQGILGAAAFGANPIMGLLAGPGIASARDRRALENEALREEIATSQAARDQRSRQNAAASKLPNLLGHDPLMDDVGELSIFNDQQRAQRAQDKRGELAEIASILSPQAMGQGLTGSILPAPQKDFRPPAIQALHEWAYPGQAPTPESLQSIADLQEGDTETRLASIELAQKTMELQAEMLRLQDEARERTGSQVTEISNISDVFSAGYDLFNSNNFLEETGSWLEPGFSGQDITKMIHNTAERITRGVGFDEIADEFKGERTALSQFVKSAARMQTQFVSAMAQAGVPSDSAFRQNMMEGLASLGSDSATNRKIVIDLYKKFIWEIEQRELDVPGMDLWKEKLAEMEAYGKGDDGTMYIPPDFRRPEGWDDLSKEDKMLIIDDWLMR